MSDLSKRANYDKKVSSLLKKYSIFNIPEEEITNIINQVSNESVEDLNESIEKITLLLNKYLKEKISEEEFINIIIRILSPTLSFKNVIKDIEKISKFIAGFDYELSIEQIMMLYNEMPNLKNRLADFIKKNEKVLNLDYVYGLTIDNLALMFIEEYCEQNEINLEPEASKDNIELKALSAERQYLTEISMPLLTKEEEEYYFLEYQKGNENARQILIERNLRLVVSIAKRYIDRGIPFLDLVQEGNLGLMRSIEKFDIKKGNRLSTYATYRIRQAITRAILEKRNQIKIPIYLFSDKSSYFETMRKLEQELGHSPSIKEVAEAMDISYDKARKLYESFPTTISLNHKVDEEDNSEIGDFIPDENVDVENNVFSTNLTSKMEELFIASNLDARLKKVLIYRFGLFGNQKLTLEETAKILNVGRERVRQLEIKAIEKLREYEAVHRTLISYADNPEQVSIYLDDNMPKKSGKNNCTKSPVSLNNIIKPLESISDEALLGLKPAISELKSKQQQLFLFYLGFYDGKRYSYDDKAHILNITSSQLTQKISYIIKLLAAEHFSLEEVKDKIEIIISSNSENTYVHKKDYKIVIPNTNLDIITRIKYIISQFSTYDQNLINLYLGFYKGPRISLYGKAAIFGLKKPNYEVRIRNLLNFIKKSLPNVETIKDVLIIIRAFNNEEISALNKKRYLELEKENPKLVTTITKLLSISYEKELEYQIMLEKNIKDHPVIQELKEKIADPIFKDLIKDMTMIELCIFCFCCIDLNSRNKSYSMLEISKILDVQYEIIMYILRRLETQYKLEINKVNMYIR